MSRTTKILGFSVPPALVKEVEAMAKAERRTKSELFREMVRIYSRYRLQRRQDEDRWISNLITEVKAEEAQSPAPAEQLLQESAELATFGVKQAKKLGLKPKDVRVRIDAYRRSRQR